MRVMAGLDAPTSGKVLVDDQDVTGQPVRKRNVAMVNQQFINYPSFTVRQNIASPLKLRGEKNIGEQVRALKSEEHTSELQSLMRISYAVFCLKKKTIPKRLKQQDSNTY